MKSKAQSLLGFITALLVLCLLALVTVGGLGGYEGVFGDEGIVLGMDLVGGTRLVYAPDTEENVSDEQINTVSSMLRARLDFYGYTEATVTVDENNRFVVEIPEVSSGEAEKLLSATAKLTFEIKDGETDTVVMEGSAIESASAEYGNTGSGYDGWFVSLKIKPEHRATFRDATAKALQTKDKTIYIKLDGEVYSEPRVSEVLDTDSVMISGTFDQPEATALAGVITSGQLPFALKVEQSAQIDATLGATALETSLVAGGIGVLLVMLFMILFYRLQGLMAAIALTGYTVCTGLLLSLLHINLSLPGIAGIILSIGMAVDANVIIFERIKEELRAGRSIHAAIRAGFGKAFVAILDSNVTTVIAVVVLFLFGTGSIQGFALTLGIGVVLSMIFAVLVTRFLLKCLAGMKVTKLSLWGVGKKKQTADEGRFEKFNYINARKYILIVVAVMVVIGIGSFAIQGFNPDVDFTGGTTMQVEFADALDGNAREISDEMLNRIIKTAESATYEDGTAVGASVSIAQRANGTQVLLKLTELDLDGRNALFEALQEEFDLRDGDLISASNVGATVSGEIRRNAVIASVVAILLMLVYISIRFDLNSGLAAVICLTHDVFIMIVAYSLFRIPLNTTMIAALLTILGYSINATIVIFDRIRENRKKLSKTDFDHVVNVSIRQTFLRSLNTTVTTFLTIATLFVLGVSSIRQFALPLMVGILAGTFSSVFLAGNLWAILNRFIRIGRKKEAPQEVSTED